jgi:hypothetical protein
LPSEVLMVDAADPTARSADRAPGDDR